MKPEETEQARLFADHGEPTRDQKDGSFYVAQQGYSFAKNLMALARVKGVGAVALRALMDAFPDLELVWSAPPGDIHAVLANARVPAAPSLAEAIQSRKTYLLREGEQEVAQLERQGIGVLGRGDPLFPPGFSSLLVTPYWLFVEGNLERLSWPPMVAIVGTRTPSRQGIKTAQMLAVTAGEAGLGVISGLAEGVDAAAHEMAARYAIPQIAVLGTGSRVVFPRSTSHIRRDIIDTGGLVITEYMPTENYGKAHFVQRNRLQAALASVVAPIEGGLNSGTAHTVRFAREADKPLLAVTHGDYAPTNELLTSLQENQHAIHDLSSAEGRAATRKVLADIPGQRWTGYRRPEPAILYRRVRTAWQEMNTYLEASEDEKLALVRQFMDDLDLESYEVVKRHDS
jgi:DNA processing protein